MLYYIAASKVDKHTHTHTHTYMYIYNTLFEPKMDGEWGRLHNAELQSLYHSPNIIRVTNSRRLSWAGHVASMEESRSAFKILARKPTGKRTFEIPRSR